MYREIDLQMMHLDTQDEPDLTQAQKDLVAKLSTDQVAKIDHEILSIASNRFLKVSFIVGTVMGYSSASVKGIPDVYYSQRIAHLVAIGKLESQGNMKNMRYSEVKLKV